MRVMNRINVPFGGITRSSDDGVSRDGMSAELINMRVGNGRLEVCDKPILERGFASGARPVYTHVAGLTTVSL